MFNFFISGSSDFVGSALIRFLIKETHNQAVNLGKPNYAEGPESLACVSGNACYKFL